MARVIKGAQGLGPAFVLASGDGEPKAVGDSGGDVGVETVGAVAFGADAVAVHPEGEVRVGAAVG